MLESNQRPPPCKGGKARCRVLHEIAVFPYLSHFLFPGLPRVASYCAPGGVRVVSECRRGPLEVGPVKVEMLDGRVPMKEVRAEIAGGLDIGVVNGVADRIQAYLP